MLNDIYNDANSRMDQAVKHTQMELNKIRTGRANPELFNAIMVDYYGTPTVISQVANINTPDSKTLVIQPWDKSILGDVENAIMMADEAWKLINE